MKPADPPRTSSDDSEEAVLSLLNSREWEARLEVAREQRRQVLEAKAAAKEAGTLPPKETAGWEGRLDAARLARDMALSRQQGAEDPALLDASGRGAPAVAGTRKGAVSDVVDGALKSGNGDPVSSPEMPLQPKNPVQSAAVADPLSSAPFESAPAEAPPALGSDVAQPIKPPGSQPVTSTSDMPIAAPDAAKSFKMPPPPARSKPAARPEGRLTLALITGLVLAVLIWGLLGQPF